MNRQQRRRAAKEGRHATPEPAEQPVARVEQAKAGLILRLFAKIVLSPAVLKRVNHADVERLLAGVAVQAGKPEIASELLNRRNAAR